MTALGNHIPHRPLGQRIAELRKLQGLTLSSLAEVCELSEATLSRIENGPSAVSAQHLFTLSQYLKVDIADFFRDDAAPLTPCLLYTSDAADDMQCVDLGGRRII